jgi:hypothetical protein
MPFITKGLEAVKSPQLQAATYMVVCQLSANSVLDEATTAALVNSIGCNLSETSFDQALACLVGITQTQHLTVRRVPPLHAYRVITSHVPTLSGIPYLHVSTVCFTFTCLSRLIYIVRAGLALYRSPPPAAMCARTYTHTHTHTHTHTGPAF